MGRRKLMFLIGWLVALVVIGIGVVIAVPANTPVSPPPDTDSASMTSTEPTAAPAPNIRTEIKLSEGAETPTGRMIVDAAWGTGPGEFGLEAGSGPIFGPPDFAVSPQGALAVLDSANARIQVLDGAGTLVQTLQLPGRIGRYVELTSDGSLAVFDAADQLSVMVLSADGGALEVPVADINLVFGASALPSGLVRRGDELWVLGTNEFCWPVFRYGKAVPPDDQQALAVSGMGRPLGDGFAVEKLSSPNQCTVSMSDASGRLVMIETIDSSEVPVSWISLLGADDRGNTYAQVALGSYEDPTPAPYCILRFAPDGSRTGALWLYDVRGDWFSTAIKVGTSGTVYQMGRSPAGFTLQAYDF